MNETCVGIYLSLVGIFMVLCGIYVIYLIAICLQEETESESFKESTVVKLIFSYFIMKITLFTPAKA